MSPNNLLKSRIPNSHRAVILTALQVEFLAVREHLTDLVEEVYIDTVYERGKFKVNDQVWEVGIVEIGAGNEEAAVEAERAIRYFEPSILFFVGVAGGIKDGRLGDVVAATKVYGYESGKAEEIFKLRPDVTNSSYALQNRARAEARKKDWLQRLGNRQPQLEPRVFVGPIAAGAKVVASTRSATWEFIRHNYNDALAVEMEAHGFLNAAHANQSVRALIVRGISDLIDHKSTSDQEGWQEIASRHASAFAFEVLAKLTGITQSELSTQEEASVSISQSTLPVSFETLQFPIHHIPYRRNPNFTGRENLLAELEATLASEPHAALVQAISGLGGVGKTQLATRYAYLHEDEYDVIWWVRSEGSANLAADYMDLARALALPVEAISEQSVVIGLARRWLESSQQKWLLVFDNADSPEQLEEFLPKKGNGHILITSRNPRWSKIAKSL
jgi:nucleoside phosphorylase